jgi:hypothetical protein
MSKARIKTPVRLAPRRPSPVPVRRQVSTVQTVLSPALRVGAVNDPAEREAETMAARVVGSSAPSPVQPIHQPATNQNAAPLRRSDQPNTDELAPEPVSAEQSEFELPATQDVATDALTPEDTDELVSGEPTPTTGEDPISPARDGATVGRMGGLAPTDVSNLVAHPGPGRPLPTGLRARVEPHFGTSFKNVRLHTTAADQKAATRIGARAFTHKNHIWLGPGESETNTRLMAHELTHVVQQTQGNETLPINRLESGTIRREGWFAGKAESAARHVPGYTLITVIVGKKLISGARVQRTATNLLGGLFGLVPGGTLIFDKLKEARVVQEAYDWVQEQLSDLNLTWSRVKNTLEDLYDGLISFSPIKNATRILGSLVRDIISFVGRITKKVLEFVVRGALKLAGPYADKVWGILQQAGDVLGLILENPLKFALNLVKSVVGGFMQFGANILKHLKNGLLGWLFGALTSAGIELPAKLDFKGLMSLVMQILGLTYKNFRDRLVKNLGPSGERKVSMIEKSVEIVKIILKEGFAGIWQKMLEMIENFKTTLIGGMTTMVISTIIRAGIGWLAGLSNPVGAVVKVILAIYDLIVAFLERLEQIMDVAKSIFSSVGAIARGQLTSAKNFVEETIGRTVPVVISFLAALLGLGGISSKIKGVIKKLQAPVLKAMDKLIKFVIKKAKKLFAKLIGKLNGKRKLPSANFKIGDKQHRIFAAQKDKKTVEVRIASVEHPIETVNRYDQKELDALKKVEDVDSASKKVGTTIDASADNAETVTRPAEKRIDLSSEKNNQLKDLKKMEEVLKNAGVKLGEAGTGIEEAAFLEPDGSASPALFRVAHPRDPNFEGEAGLYKDLTALASQPVVGLDKKVKSVKRSEIYELDHVIEKQFAKTILKNLHLLDARNENADASQVAGVKKNDNADHAGRAKSRVYRTPFKTADGRKLQPAKIGRVGQGKGTSRTALGADTERKGVHKVIKLDSLSGSGADLPAVAVYYRNHRKDKVPVPPTEIVKNAVATGGTTQARHAEVAKGLVTQLNHEIGAISQQMDIDRTSVTALRKRVALGLTKMREINANIFNLDLAQIDQASFKTDEDKTREAQGNDPNVTDWRNAAGKAKFGPTDAPLTGGGGHPDFTAIEGVGGPYNAGARSKAGYLESDHIVDKIFPLTAQNENISDDISAIEAKAKAKTPNGTLDKNQSARLQLLAGLIFPSGSAMANYSTNNGYAIPLQQTLAKRVTSGTSSNAAQVKAKVATGRATTLANQVDFVVTGTPDLNQIRMQLRAPIETAFVDQSDAHIDAVAREYVKDLREIPASHPVEIRADATRHMTRIVSQVQRSLVASDRATKALF